MGSFDDSEHGCDGDKTMAIVEAMATGGFIPAFRIGHTYVI